MKKYIFRYVIFLFCLFLYSVSANGQDEALMNRVEKLHAENLKLQKDIETLNFEISKLEKGIEDHKGQIATIDAEYKKLETSWNERTASVSPDVIAQLEKDIASLKKQKESLENEKTRLASQLEKTNNRIGGTQNQLASNGNYVAKMEQQEKAKQKAELEHQYAENKSLMTRKFSEISTGDIDRLKESKEKFKSMSGYSDYVKRVADFDKKYSWYREGIGYLKDLNAVGKVKALREKIIPYLDKNKKDNSANGFYTFSSEQFSEMDSLDIALSRFKGGIENFKALIQNINNDEKVKKCRDEKNAEVCTEEIKSILYNSVEGKNMRDRYNVVTILNNMYNQYIEDIENNSLQHYSVEKEILDFKID